MSDGRADTTTTKAVILARGLGTRMRKADDGAALDAAQAAAADTGMKGMIPIGRPFMDYLISALADAGFTDVCLVIGPEHEPVRAHYGGEVVTTRVRVHFAVQREPLGTADAVIAAEAFAGGAPFAVINSDNYYAVEALAALRRRAAPVIVGFERMSLVRLGNVPPERVSRFGALDVGADGHLRRILATPTPEMEHGDILASLNCWSFTREIFGACRDVPRSARGEYELPQAVQLAIDRGMRMKVIAMHAAVLDMSSRADIASVAERLAGVEVRL
ncbi:MAG TPA: sugar phosphate nucleotidyltransferase [Gemmatimonadaceae bacterium]|nr:sugar phosphate nucleotidyltransferase [Gemmatimonadaceae bacterium]